MMNQQMLWNSNEVWVKKAAQPIFNFISYLHLYLSYRNVKYLKSIFLKSLFYSFFILLHTTNNIHLGIRKWMCYSYSDLKADHSICNDNKIKKYLLKFRSRTQILLWLVWIMANRLSTLPSKIPNNFFDLQCLVAEDEKFLFNFY